MNVKDVSCNECYLLHSVEIITKRHQNRSSSNNDDSGRSGLLTWKSSSRTITSRNWAVQAGGAQNLWSEQPLAPPAEDVITGLEFLVDLPM